MTPKENAKSLVATYRLMDFRSHGPANYEIAKQCALIAVDEIMVALDVPGVSFPDKILIGTPNNQRLIGGVKYWQEVKKEIELLKYL